MLAAGLLVAGLATAGIAFGIATDSGGISSRPETNFGEVPVANGAIVDENGGGDELVPLEEERVAVPVHSGLFSAIDANGPAAPVRLRIGELQINAPVIDIGYEVETGVMEIPASPQTVGWYRFGPSPGEEGSSVLTAHVDWGGEAGVFYFLYELEAGDIVYVDYDDESTQAFRVVAGRMYHKEVLPTEELFRTDGGPVLTLITCGGDYVDDAADYQVDGYQNNVVVYAVPVELGTAAAA